MSKPEKARNPKNRFFKNPEFSKSAIFKSAPRAGKKNKTEHNSATKGSQGPKIESDILISEAEGPQKGLQAWKRQEYGNTTFKIYSVIRKKLAPENRPGQEKTNRS